MRPPLPSPEDLRQALGALPPREGQLLGRLLLDALPPRACARLYGISEEALAVHLLRAGRNLAHALGPGGGSAPPEEEASDEVERREAAALWRALFAPVGEPAPGVPGRPEAPGALAPLLGHVRASAGAVRAALQRAADEAADSPAGRREELARRAAILLLVGLTAYFLLR
jgi:hypothetical protein